MDELQTILKSAGPYMGAALIMCFVQGTIVKVITQKGWRVRLLAATIIFQMLALGSGIVASLI